MAASAPRPCRSCGAALAPEQDWCLECGTARPGRLGRAPGWKPIAAVAGLTLAMVGGASVAAYAGLESEAGQVASAPVGPDAAPVAGGVPAIPPSVTPAVPVEPVKPPPAPTTQTPPATGTPIDPVTPRTGLGSGTELDTGAGTGTGSGTTGSGTTGSGTTGSGTTGSGTTGSGTTGSGTTGSGGTTDGDGTDTGREAEPDAADDPARDPDALVPLALDAGASKAYDPYARSTVASDPAQATDGKRSTAWTATVPGDGPLQVGLVVDLESTKAIRGVRIGTTTPGFSVEIYGTDSPDLPADVADARWEHPADRSRVDAADRRGDPAGDGSEQVLLGKTRRYRYVLLWITVPPAEGRTVRLSDVKILA